MTDINHVYVLMLYLVFLQQNNWNVRTRRHTGLACTLRLNQLEGTRQMRASRKSLSAFISCIIVGQQ